MHGHQWSPVHAVGSPARCGSIGGSEYACIDSQSVTLPSGIFRPDDKYYSYRGHFSSSPSQVIRAATVEFAEASPSATSIELHQRLPVSPRMLKRNMNMKSNLNLLISTVGAAAIALTLVASASAQTRNQTYRPSEPVHRMSECSDPGAHIWCPAAPSHLNNGAASAGT